MDPDTLNYGGSGPHPRGLWGVWGEDSAEVNITGLGFRVIRVIRGVGMRVHCQPCLQFLHSTSSLHRSHIHNAMFPIVDSHC